MNKRIESKKATGYATCRLCGNKIEKGETVLMLWMSIQYHAQCLIKEVVRAALRNNIEIDLEKIKKELILDSLENE